MALLSPDGEWTSLGVSQVVETPAAEPSQVVDAQWRMRPEDEEALGGLMRRALPSSEATSAGHLGASRLESSFAVASRAAGSWGHSFAGAGGAGRATRTGANGHAQADLPGGALKTQSPHFKVKLPRRVEGVGPAKPTWPPAETPAPGR
jgi:hypothetical protein